ncbi:hypothetical protein FRX31_009809 [Thalictrum thalictroides]|uniref:Defensin-like protein n=1 Tax=Thalictrum thalictroides TaxID=46969 RepID=A0A7J6WT73_THATH|nr:hypothetical protein FRX31_009809 [Thalictrum thalictroides]
MEKASVKLSFFLVVLLVVASFTVNVAAVESEDEIGVQAAACTRDLDCMRFCREGCEFTNCVRGKCICAC